MKLQDIVVLILIVVGTISFGLMFLIILRRAMSKNPSIPSAHDNIIRDEKRASEVLAKIEQLARQGLME